ncbi:MAG: metal ABC transporter permease [Fluviicola sp.]|nr:metal ABC transporter permease [Fluviicola sp.]
MGNGLIIITALLVALPASLLGVFLMMRRLVMVGDAISHAVLPGIVVAYLITESRDSFPMLLGAAVMGVLTTMFIDFLNRRIRIQQDAAIGTAFTFLFAVGVLLIAFFAGTNTDLDQECVLYGDLETSFLDQRIWGGYLVGTGAIFQLLPLNILVLTVIVFAFRPLTVWAFNSDFGKLLGMKTGRWQLLMMSLVSIHAVFSFESVGAIMVVGMLVLPASAAYLISNKLSVVLFLSATIGILGCVVGFFVALWLNVSIAPTIVSICGLFFTTIWLVQWLRGERKVIQTGAVTN